MRICWTRQTWLRLSWFMHVMVSLAFLVLSVYTAHNIQKVNFSNITSNTKIGSGGGASQDSTTSILFDSISELYKIGLLGSTVLGFLIVSSFLLFSSIVFLWVPKPALCCYGALIGASCMCAVFLSLCGLILISAEALVNQVNSASTVEEDSSLWTQDTCHLYTATYAFAFALAWTFCLLFITLLISLRRVNQQETAAERSPAIESYNIQEERTGPLKNASGVRGPAVATSSFQTAAKTLAASGCTAVPPAGAPRPPFNASRGTYDGNNKVPATAQPAPAADKWQQQHHFNYPPQLIVPPPYFSPAGPVQSQQHFGIMAAREVQPSAPPRPQHLHSDSGAAVIVELSTISQGAHHRDSSIGRGTWKNMH
ncbi:hypothetical protein CEUSTIGMA_g1146.t1 [Chlamydomonas eustigma]|uniref:Uncharacterized protein n=1 Tax=Chlamydomonas eustigma TaxID=1157962 RepID=A0A250WS67_9CHLO|nr:hypothetical protein CEUSTIGMA_g1146.t1 [Chlamydomonas eustigma]|eukprot:GAX73694.1 hypothetical protein CEUSTIGMA_g1146.t1 [Chlamydomonas eustigma]